MPKEERSEEYTNRDDQVNSITYEMLVDAVNSIKRELK